MLEDKMLKDFTFSPRKRLCNKSTSFFFNKFPNVNKELGPEMKSTGGNILY